MGSWANSIHVRHNNPAVVADAVRAIFLGQGYKAGEAQTVRAAVAEADDALPERLPQPEHVAPEYDFDSDEDQEAFERDLEGYDENAPYGGEAMVEDSGPRRVSIYRPRGGWIGILDSVSFGDLGSILSARLQTDALDVYVNDSDAWGYVLHRKGKKHDAFDTSGDPTGEGEEENNAELLAAIERGDEREVERIMFANAPQGPIVFHDGRMAPPPEMGMLRVRMKEGKATLGDRFRYAWLWIKFQFRKLFSFVWPPAFGFDVPQVKPLDAATLDEHIAKLRGVFPEASEAALRTLLPQSRFPAEGLLAEFLQIIGLPARYSDLSFDYVSDFGEDELAADGIVHELTLSFSK
jgi:hypothetical protein